MVQTSNHDKETHALCGTKSPRSTTMAKKCCNKCNACHSMRRITGDDHWSKVLQANEIHFQALPPSLKRYINMEERQRSSPNYIKKLCTHVQKWIKRKTSPKKQKMPSTDCDVKERLDTLICGNFFADSCSWDRGSVTSVDSDYYSQPSTPAKTRNSSISSQQSQFEESFISCQFPNTPASLDRHRSAKETGSISRDFNPSATWPLMTPPDAHNDEAYDSVFDDSDDEDCDDNDDDNIKSSITDILKDCTIPFEDLEFGRCLRRGRLHDTYRGKWHGEVLIHKYKNLSEDQTQTFWEQVARLSKIRHENVSLFMGVCPENDHPTVVTSVRSGLSLFESLHQKKYAIPLSEKIYIARQVAQGLGYLHARGVVLEKMNSKNIHLESKVKICLVDQGMAEDKCDRDGFGCLPKGHLSYVAPEILKTAHVESPKLRVDDTKYSEKSDIYAFGTILYELMSGEFPMSENDPHTTIWKICCGRRQGLEKLLCPGIIKKLIEDCWHEDPAKRPKAVDISKILHMNVGLQKRHSSSEPERLNKLGLKRAFFP